MHQTWNATRVLFKSVAGLLQAEATEEAVLVFYSVFSSLESSCLYRGHGFPLLFVLKNPLSCHFGVPSSSGGFLSAGLQAHEWFLSHLHAGGDLSTSTSPFFFVL